MMKQIFVLVVVLGIVCASAASDPESQVQARKRYGYGLFYRSGLYSILLFLAIKVKVVFLFFFFFTGLAFLTKIWAAAKFGKNLFGGGCHEEAVILNHDPYVHGHEYAGAEPSTFDYTPHSSFDSHGPPTYDPHGSPDYSTYGNVARGFAESLIGNTDMMKNIVHRMDLTEVSFNSMDITDESCKRRFVCEADLIAKRNSLVGFGLYLLSDTGLTKYRDSNSTARTIQDCQGLYKACKTLMG